VTVEQRRGRLLEAGIRPVELVDLPGTYALDPRSDDERIATDVLNGRMPGGKVPDAVLVVLDATHLARHLTVVAPVLALGLPTLVVLNMADDLQRRGGEVDPAALADQLGTSVVLASAATGEGLDTIRRFLTGRFGVPARVALPVLQSVPACRAWAGQLTDAWPTGHRCRRSGRTGSTASLHPVAGPLIFFAVVWGLSGDVRNGSPVRWHRGRHRGPRGMAGNLASGWSRARPPAGGSARRSGLRAGLPATDPGALPPGRHPGRLRLHGTRGPDRRPDHGQGRPAGEVLHPPAVRARLRRPGRDGGANHREPPRSPGHYPDRTVHDLRGATARLHPDHRRLPADTPLLGRFLGMRAAASSVSISWVLAALGTARLLKSTILRASGSRS
jgi:hypothetical protein